MSKKKNQKEKMTPRAIIKIVILISVIALIILLPLIYSGVTYITAWNNNQVTPYAPTITTNDDGSTTETAKISDIVLNDKTVRMDGKDFNLFDINFEATYYNDREDEHGTDTQTIKYSVKITKNDNSPSTIIPISTSSSYYFKSAVAICSNWIGLDTYSTSLTSFAFETTKSISVKCTTQFPAKANTWPVPVVVESPDCYLYLYFQTQENGKTVVNTYILKYTYQEYMTENTTGGIRK